MTDCCFMKHKLDYAELLCPGHVVAVEDSEGNNGPDTCIGDSIFLYRKHQAKVVVMQWLRRLSANQVLCWIV